MRCHEFRRLIGAYLDSELDCKTSFEVEDHMKVCPPCAKFFEADNKIESRIKDCLCSGEKSDDLWDEVEERTSTEAALTAPPVRTRTRARVAWFSALAAAAAVVVGLGIFWSAQASSNELAPEVARRHQAYVDGIVEPAFACPKGQDISGQCGGRLDEQAFMVLPQSAAFQAVGARVCRISDTPVAWTLAKEGTVPVSVISFRREELARFPAAARQLAGGNALYCCRSGKYIVAIRTVGDYVVCAVGEAPTAFMEQLVGRVTKPAALASGI